MDLLVWLIYKYPAGLYRLGQSAIYTCPGTGTWGPPMRFLSRSEIVELVLVR
jgi:predicted MPP superfamily phosphohydrolase